MNTLRRSLVMLLAVFALVTACGDDKESTPSTIPSTVASASQSSTPSTTVPATVAQRVTDGAVCTTPGARGTTQAGLPMVCTQVAGSNETRWRPA